jgi:hypothetical protein
MASLAKQGFEKLAQLDSGTVRASDLDIRAID